MIVIDHVVDVLYVYRGLGEALDKTLNSIITIEAQAGFDCVGVEKVYADDINESKWLLLFAKSEQLPTRT